MTQTPMRPLRDLAEINPRAARISPDETVSFIGMADMDDTAARNVSETARRFEDVSKGYTPFQNGDLLAAKITPCWQNGKVGEAVIDYDHGMGSTEFHVVRPGPDTDRRYLLHFLRTPHVRDTGTLRMTGSGGQRRVPAKYISDLAVPTPPLSEQRRITSILDEADAIRTKRRAQLAHLDELPQTLFRDTFPPGASATRPLGELAQVSSGITVGRRTSESTKSVPYLAVTNVQAGALALENVKQIEATEREIERYSLKSGDVVLTEGGDPDKLGRGTVWREELPTCLHQNHVFRVRFPEDGDILPEYFSSLLGQQETRQYFLRSAKQTTGIASINMTQLRALPVPISAIASQKAFLERLAAIRAERDRVANALEADEELFAALQHRAFRGEL